MGELIIPQFDTAPDHQVSVSLDVGVIPLGYPSAGKFVVTLQAWPFPDRKSAQITCDAIREAVNSRLGIKMKATNA